MATATPPAARTVTFPTDYSLGTAVLLDDSRLMYYRVPSPLRLEMSLGSYGEEPVLVECAGYPGHPSAGRAMEPAPALPAAEVRLLADKLEIPYTPKHGSWQTMAEIELNVLAEQCLHCRLPEHAMLEREVALW